METSTDFLSSWNQYMYVGAAASVGVGILILLYYEYKIIQIKDYKDRYDYVNLNQIRFFWYTVVAMIAAAAFFANTIATAAISESEGLRWFYVRLFISLSFTVIVYFIFFSLIKIYYPRKLEKRLSKIRNIPRKSPAGNLMRKLAEHEEDVHLEASQIHEESIHAVDYDVWIDEQTGYKKVEKYPVYQHAEECPECGYYTMKIKSEEIEVAPTESEKGLLLEHFQCSYCGHREQHEVSIASLSANAS